MHRLSCCLPALLTLACAGPVSTGPGDETAVTGDVTYYADAKAVVDTHCVRCHSGDGHGPGDFTAPDYVKTMGESILEAVESGRMPPPAADPDCQDYVASDALFLDDSERAVLAAWVEGGKPLGDEADDPGVQALVSELAAPDLVTYLPTPYEPSYDSIGVNEGNEYTCFVLDPGHDDDVFVSAMAPVVDNDRIVHHIVLYLVGRDATEQYLDTGAFDCNGSIGSEVGDAGEAWLAAWAPGMQPVEFPEGSGIRMSQDQLLLMQVHYYASEQGVTDQSGYAFDVVDSVDTEIYLYDPGIFDFEIPAGDDDYTASGSFDLPVDIDIHGVMPHMHVLGSGYEMTSDEACLVQGDAYDFDNQMTYMFDEPVRLSEGSEVEMSCTWNNSSSNPDLILDTPEDTTWGESTHEEMCYFFTYLSVP